MAGRFFAAALLAMTMAGCRADTGNDDAAPAAGQQTDQPATQPMQPPPMQAGGGMEIEVDVAARQLHVYRGGQRVESHPVAVGSTEWPTQTGEWTISQVVFNPEWVPPDEEWARDEERTPPGDPDNPLGRAQLVYDAPRSIHGTNAPESLGQAVSHGSIRVANDVAVQLARQVMDAGGAQRDETFFRQVEQDRSRRETIDIPNPVPIRVVSGSGAGQARGS
jgi:lipoprotein-anchoring transpeptidase ErfK/SrfK